MAIRTTYRSRLYDLLADERGIVTSAMAEEVGVPKVELRKLLQRGALERVGRGVYRLPFAPISPKTSALEALKLVGPQSFISGQSVLAVLDLGVANPRKLEIGTPKRIRKAIPAGISVTKVSILESREVFTYDEIQCQKLTQVISNLIGKELSSRILDVVSNAVDRGYLTKQEAKHLRRKITDVRLQVK